MKTSYLMLAFACVILQGCGKKNNETQPLRKDITETVFASGTLEPENKYNLTAQTDGYVVELKFDNGDTVTAGQVLALIDNKTNNISALSAENLLALTALNASDNGPTLKQALQNLQLLNEKKEQDSVQFNRYQKLFQSNSVSKLELENMRLNYENSKTNYLNAGQNYKLLHQQTAQQLIQQRSQRDISGVAGDNNQVKAVVGGKVYKRLKEIGDYVRRGDIIAVIGDAIDVYAKLSVDENNIAKVKPGQEVIIQLNTEKEKNYEGFVSEIYPAFDENSQSFFCKIKFVNGPAFKISGTQLQANIVIARKQNALVIPKQYLSYGNKVVIKGLGEKDVKTGFISGEWVEILEGVNEQTVLTTDQIK